MNNDAAEVVEPIGSSPKRGADLADTVVCGEVAETENLCYGVKLRQYRCASLMGSDYQAFEDRGLRERIDACEVPR